MNDNINFFETLVLRTPALSLNQVPRTDSFFENLSAEGKFLQALFIANPDVHGLTMEFLQGKLTDKSKIARLKETVINYYLRMCTNSTPFGYFAKVSTLRWENAENKTVINNETKPHVRLDMMTLEKLINYLKKNPSVLPYINFFVNNTVYSVNDQYRFIETIQASGKSEFTISAVEKSEILLGIFQFMENGKTIKETVDFLKEGDYKEYSEDDLNAFMRELIDSQLLDSELQLNLIGEDPFERIYEMIKCLPLEEDQALYGFLDGIRKVLIDTNNNLLSIIDCIAELDRLFQREKIEIDRKTLVQVDLYSIVPNGYLSTAIQADLKKALVALSYFEQPIYKPKLDEFKRQFISRYEDKAMPLLEVLDAEIGIGFGKFKYQSNNILYDESIILKPIPTSSGSAIHTHPAKLMLSSKMIDAIKNDEYTVVLNEKDLENLQPSDYEFGDTFQIMFSLLDFSNGLIELHTAGHTSAGSLLGRFGSGNEQIHQLLTGIAQVEQERHENALMAEILHIPEARIANLSFRPKIRHYEIPIINRSILDSSHQILLEDIYVAIIHNRIVLLSKKHQCEVIAKLTTAHNYNKNSNPIYQFLSELQYQDIVPSVNLKLDYLDFIGEFIPRVQYGNVILSKAKWKFKSNDIITALTKSADPEKRKAFLKKWKLPEYVHYLKNGKEVFLEWDSEPSLYVFLKYAATVSTITVIEFPVNKESAIIVDENNQPIMNEFIAAAINLKSPKRNVNASYIKSFFEKNKPLDKFFPGNEWVYYKIYCGVKVGDLLLAQEIADIVEILYRRRVIDRFYFIRYNDPDYHLRLRFRCSNSRKAAKLIRDINELFDQTPQKQFIWNIKIDTYTRELTRYGNKSIDQAEAVFEKSSFFWINYLKITNSAMDYYLPIIFVCSVDSLLNGLKYKISDKLNTLESLKNSYESEFGVNVNKELQKMLNKKEKDFRKLFESCVSGDYSAISAFIDIENLKYLFSKFQNDVSLLIQTFSQEDTFNNANTLSLIHMHAIRCFKTRPRENELFSYLILYNFYKKQFLKLGL